MKHTPIADLGEFALIDRLTAPFAATQPYTLKGIGDDAAVLQHGKACTLLNTQLLLEGIHFNLMYTPLKHLGYKAVVAGVSNIVAMNGTPRQLLLAVGVSARFMVEDLEQLYEGVRIACTDYGVDLVGGDTSASVNGLTIAATLVGEADHAAICYRSGAKVNDLICISGSLGAAYMGLQVLERERRVYETNPSVQPQLEGFDYLLQRQLHPQARLDMVAMFKEHKIQPSSMIDLSDGLASELLHICKQSEVGSRIYLEKIPIASETFKACEEMGIDAVTAALNGGDDYELLFTVPIELHEQIKGLAGFEIIGHITEAAKGAFLVTPEGQEVELRAQGWIKND